MNVFMHEGLSTHTSPDIISAELVLKHDVMLSEGTIYRYIGYDIGNGGALIQGSSPSGKILQN
ncbi:hypothetical protein [Candidatus Enterovibrio escicola]|uniref:hypothetical protein n=1 Tax=Candidatus Enterovibrio escicola TaxID=1927127 RepID=UPI000BE31B2C|nr:hypothetical protein [Candidatus Enterovibrio escacola]